MATKHMRNLSMGAALWILNAQYLVMQGVVAADWTKGGGYSWSNNTISDLANTQCGQYGVRFVCSPLHTVMNTSFIIVGVTIIGGAVLLGKSIRSGLTSRLGFLCMAVAGAGAILIGFFPENSVSALHVTGAVLSFLLGNLGMIMLGATLSRAHTWLRVYTVLSGVVGLVAAALFLKGVYAGLGIGGMERIASYPQTIWMILFGVYILLGHRMREAKQVGQE